MKCPNCNHKNHTVLQTRSVKKGNAIKRRRECKRCKHAFTTYEIIAPNVRKPSLKITLRENLFTENGARLKTTTRSIVE